MTVDLFSYEEIDDICDKFVKHRCQIREIIYELLYNLNYCSILEIEKSGLNKENIVSTIEELVSSIRSSHPASDFELYKLLHLTPEEFSDKQNDLSKEHQEEVDYLYHTFWHHNNISMLFNSGKIKDEKSYKVNNIPEVENLAEIYLGSKFLKSKTLDYLIIDSLLFAETVAFANTQNELPAQKFWSMATRYSWNSIKFLVSEGFALFITALISNVIDSSQGTVYWIAFATITIIRWLNPTKFQRLKFKTKPVLLLLEMMGFYDAKFKHSKFNAKLTQEMLFDLEKKGASYSHWVYHILDRNLKS